MTIFIGDSGYSDSGLFVGAFISSITVPSIVDIYGASSGGIITISLSSYNSISSVTFGGVGLTELVEVDGETVTARMPSTGFKFGSSYDLVVTDSVGASEAYSVFYTPPIGMSFVTLTSNYDDFPSDSIVFQKTDFSPLVAGDQVAYENPIDGLYSLLLDGQLVPVFESSMPSGDYQVALSIVDSSANYATTSGFFTLNAAADATPQAISFDSEINADPLDTLESSIATVLDIDPAELLTISVENGEYRVDAGGGFGAWTSSQTAVKLNDKVQLKGTSSDLYETLEVVTLHIGSLTTYFSITTRAEDEPTANPAISIIMYAGVGSYSDDGIFVGDYNTVAGPDTVSPVITITGGTTAMTVGDIYTPPVVTVNDDVDGVIGTITETGSVNEDAPGVYEIRYGAIDLSGNVADEAIHTVIVSAADADNTAIQFDLGENVIGAQLNAVEVRPFNVAGIDTATTFSATGDAQISVDGISWTKSFIVSAPTEAYMRLIASGQNSTLVTGGVESGSVSDSITITTISASLPSVIILGGDNNVSAGDTVSLVSTDFTHSSSSQVFLDNGVEKYPLEYVSDGLIKVPQNIPDAQYTLVVRIATNG